MEHLQNEFSFIKKVSFSYKEPYKLKTLPYENNKDIIHFKNVISKEDCRYIIETCEEYFNWDDARTFGNVENYRKTKMIPLTSIFGYNPHSFKAHSILGYSFKISFEEFQKYYTYEDAHDNENKIKTHVFYEGDEGFQILKYEPNNFYKEHIDAGSTVKRKYSTIMYLNEDYEGGETFFPRGNISVKGSTGDILFFPSTYTHPHIAQEVKSGIKYTAVVWSF